MKLCRGSRRADADVASLEYRRVVRIGAGDIHVETGCGGRAAGVAGDIEIEADGVDGTACGAGSRDVEVETCECIGAGGDDACICDSEFQSFGTGGRGGGR